MNGQEFRIRVDDDLNVWLVCPNCGAEIAGEIFKKDRKLFLEMHAHVERLNNG